MSPIRNRLNELSGIKKSSTCCLSASVSSRIMMLLLHSVNSYFIIIPPPENENGLHFQIFQHTRHVQGHSEAELIMTRIIHRHGVIQVTLRKKRRLKSAVSG